MGLQRWSSQHVDESGEQLIENGKDLKGFLGAQGLGGWFISSTSKVFGMHTSQDAGMLFSCFSPKGNRKKVAVYGLGGKVRASVDTERMTEYNTVYFGEPREIMGESFFSEIFGRAYLTKGEQRAQSVGEIIERKQQWLDHMDDRICCIMERFWHCQEKNASCCFILMLPSEQILEQSMAILSKVYRLIPQQLRIESGFAVDVRAEDFGRTLTEMSISFVTIKEAFYDEVRRSKKTADVICDCEDWQEEGVDLVRLQKIKRLWRMVKENPSLMDAKLAYAEQYVIHHPENRAKYPGFVHMQRILDMVLGDAQDYFWWENPSLRSLNELYDGYCQQQKIVGEMEVLTESEKDVLTEERNRFLGLRLTQLPNRERLFEPVTKEAEDFFMEQVPQVRDLFDTLMAATREWQRQVQETKQGLDDAYEDRTQMECELKMAQDELQKTQSDLDAVQEEMLAAKTAQEQSQEALEREKIKYKLVSQRARLQEKRIKELEERLKKNRKAEEDLSVIKVDGVDRKDDFDEQDLIEAQDEAKEDEQAVREKKVRRSDELRKSSSKTDEQSGMTKSQQIVYFISIGLNIIFLILLIILSI